jgi:ribulose-bisphosphate carboxylase large chain
MAIQDKDIEAFFTNPDTIDDNYLICDYFFETSLPPKKAAAGLCSELSTAQWQRPGVDEDLRPEFAAKVIAIEILKKTQTSLYPFPWTQGTQFTQCQIKVAYPIIHLDSSIPTILSALAGEGAFYAPGITTLRLNDIQFPDKLLAQFPGPQFGIEGLRNQLSIHNRPFFIGVVKPNLGLPPKDFAELAYESWLGELDIAKDDEMLTNPKYSPLKERMKVCNQMRVKAEEQTKKKSIMIANITDENSELKKRYDEAVGAGANAVMLNPFFTGHSAVRQVREFSTVPIMGHFTGMALNDRIPQFGIDGRVLVKLQRLAGCDMIGLPGFGDRMHNTDEIVKRNIESCLEPMGKIKAALPIPGGSDWAGTLPKVYAKIGHANFGFISGRGIFAHPEGPKGGAKSLHEAWHAVQNNESLSDAAKPDSSLAKALKAFG